METPRHPPQSPRPPPREPEPGRLDELQFRDPIRRGVRQRRYPWFAWNWRWTVCVAGVFVVLLLALRQPLADWLWPEPRAQSLLEQAGQALTAGRLTAPDGTGARELYEAALAVDPDRADAREGLVRVGEAALEQAHAAMARRQYAQAHRALALAGELTVPRAKLERAREQLRRHETASVAIDDLLAQAVAARAAGRLDGDSNAALPLYQRVLELQPDLTPALEGREDTLSDLLQQARKALAAGDLAGAADTVHRVQAADAGHVELPDAIAELGRAAERQRRRADADLRRGRLSQALEGYRAALRIDPRDAEAARGVIAVAAAHARRSERLAADYRFEQAAAELRQAREVAGPEAGGIAAIAEAQQHLSRARQSQRQTGSVLTPAQRNRRVTQLLAEAAQAEARGELLTPPGDSAFDKLRAAQAIAADHPRVVAAAKRLSSASADCFTDALRGNELVRAHACLDARGTLDGDTAPVRAGRRELALRWVAMGDQRLTGGDIHGARRALAKAKQLDAAAEGLEAFAERLSAASPSADR